MTNLWPSNSCIYDKFDVGDNLYTNVHRLSGQESPYNRRFLKFTAFISVLMVMPGVKSTLRLGDLQGKTLIVRAQLFKASLA